MAEVEGSDGNNYNIPDFALEDTQGKILDILKKQFKLNDQEVKNAQNAINNDNKNSKAQLDAFKKLGVDLQKAMDGKGSLLGGLSKGVNVAGGALGFLTKGFVGLAASVGVVGTSLAALSLNITKGFGEDLRASGLAETGAAFGELGSQLNTLVPQIQSMGMSLDTTLGVIQDFRQTLTVVGTEATRNLVQEFNRLTASGSAYGRTLSENTEYLADEIDFRQRLMFMDQQDSALNARLTKEVFDSQIESAKLLGKSVKDIANNTKAMILGNKSLQSVLSSMPAEALTEIQKSLNTFSGIELPESFQASLMQAIADPVFLMSDEAKDLFNNIGMVNNQQSKILQKEMADMQEAVQSRDVKKIAAANKEFESAVVNFAGSIEGEDQARLQMFADSGFAYIQDLLINQQLAAKGMERFVEGGGFISVSNAARLSAMFNTQIEALEASFGSINTAVKSGFAPALENVTNLLGEVSDEKSALGGFNTRIGKISTKLTQDLQKLLGLTDSTEAQKKKELAEARLIESTDKLMAVKEKEGEDSEAYRKANLERLHALNNRNTAALQYDKAIENDQALAKKGLKVVGDLIDEFATYLTGLVEQFKNEDGTLLERLGKVITNNVLVPLGNTLMDGLMKFFGTLPDIMDIITGNTDFQKAAVARKEIGRLEDQNLSPQKLASERSKIAEDLIEFARDQNYSVKETAKLLKDATMDFQDLTPEQLARAIRSQKGLQNLVDAGLVGDVANQKDLFNDLLIGLTAREEEFKRRVLASKDGFLIGDDFKGDFINASRFMDEDSFRFIDPEFLETTDTPPARPSSDQEKTPEEIVGEERPGKENNRRTQMQLETRQNQVEAELQLIALQKELDKIEERLGKNINRRTRMQLETRQKQVEAELQLLKPIEISSPVNPNNISIMTNISTDESTQNADSDNLTKKQESDGASDITGGNSNSSLTNKEFAKMIGHEISIQLVPALQNIDKNTKKGASASSAVAANTQ